MSTVAATALANRSLRTIRAVRVPPPPPPLRPANPAQELEFLADTSVISGATLAQLLALLPAEMSSLTAPVAKSTAVALIPKPTAPVAAQHFLPIAQPPPPSYTPTPSPVISVAEALWAFPGTEAGDLSFQAGDKLEVLEKVKDDWWKGRIVGREATGLFPSSYVREVQVLKEKPPLPNLPPRGGATTSSSYGPGGNPMTDVAHGTSVFEAQQQEESAKKPLLGKNGEKFGKKLGNAAIFGAVSSCFCVRKGCVEGCVLMN